MSISACKPCSRCPQAQRAHGPKEKTSSSANTGGATSLERFIDASTPLIPDYAATPANIPNLDPLDKFYRWRIVENRQFAP
jgi:hypothetical protein